MNHPSSPGQASAEQSRPANSNAFLHVLYHELNPDPGLYKYALSTAAFRTHLRLFARLRSSGHRGLWPEITFDDGHASNFHHAVPLLAEAGLKATFFITAGWTEQRPEYMTWEQVQQTAQAGHPIGAHGWSHKLLTRCSDAELAVELGRTREVLEDKLGAAITTISLPGGRFDARVIASCRRYGYERIYTSVPRAETQPAAEMIGRLNLRSDASAEWLETVFALDSGPLQRIERQYRVKATAQRVLGDALYGRLWTLLNKADHAAEPA